MSRITEYHRQNLIARLELFAGIIRFRNAIESRALIKINGATELHRITEATSEQRFYAVA